MPIGYGIGVNYKAHIEEANVSSPEFNSCGSLPLLTLPCDVEVTRRRLSARFHENTR